MPSNRKITTSAKPASAAKPAPAATAPAATPKPASNVAKPNTGLIRDARNITGNTDFATFTARDADYLSFFGRVARANNGRATVAQLYAAGVPRPGKNARLHYIPNTGNRSTKATDGDAYDRLAADGYLTVTGDADNPDARVLTPTDKAKASSLYLGTK